MHIFTLLCMSFANAGLWFQRVHPTATIVRRVALASATKANAQPYMVSTPTSDAEVNVFPVHTGLRLVMLYSRVN